MPIKVIAAPSGEQITLAEARLHLRLDDDGDSPAAHPDDTLIQALISASREYCEGWLGRALAPQTIEYATDAFPDGPIYLPMSPIVSLTWVKYTDSNAVVQTFTGYDFDSYSEPARVRLAVNGTWPTIYDMPNAVKVRYQAGYSLPGDSPNTNPLPFSLKAAMLLVLGSLYEQRENSSAEKLDDIPLGAHALMMPYRIRLAMA